MCERYVESTNAWFRQRKRYKDIVVKFITIPSKENFKAEFVVEHGLHYIYIYGQDMVNFYKRFSSSLMGFEAFFISIIIHELTHRKQYLASRLSFRKFKELYVTNKHKYELNAVSAEIRFTNYFILGRKQQKSIDDFYI
jgi:hypothetical protein